jgi:hypothetical protein
VEPPRLEKAVALANEAIQIGQGGDLLRPLGGIVGDYGQPESQLGEPYSGRIAVDPEQVVPQHAPLPFRGGRTGRPTLGKPLERPEQESA